MSRNTLFATFAAALAASILITWGCGSDSSDPISPGPNPEDFIPLMLSDEDKATVNAVDARFYELRTGLDLIGACAALVDEVNAGWENTTAASLASDGTSIRLDMAGGETVLMIMDQAASYRNVGSAGGKSSEKEPVPAAVACLGKRPPVRATKDDPSCDEITVPTSQKVHIVNLTGALWDYTVDMADQLRQSFIDLGWDPEDVVLTQVTSFDDRGFTPQEFLDQTGYGAVLLVTGGGHRDFDGLEHTFHGIWNGGEYEDYQEQLTPTQWEQIQNWRDADQIVPISHTIGEGEDPALFWGIRDDLLVEQLAVDPGTLVSFVGAYTDYLESDLRDGSAGMVTTWEGGCPIEYGLNSYEVMIEHMVDGDNGMDAMSAGRNSEWGSYSGELGEGSFSTGVMEAIDFHLPAQLDFDAPDECAEPGTVYYEVDVNYADCPERNQSIQFFRGGDFSMKGLPPYGAELSLVAKNADGETIGAAAAQPLDLTGGPNDVELCPCEGTFTADMDDLPPGADGVLVVADYNDPNAGPDSDYSTLPNLVFNDLMPLESTLRFSVVDVAANVLGEYEIEDVEIGCDGTTVHGCFGWLEFPTNNLPDQVTSLDVSCNLDGAFPSSLTLAPGGTGGMYGFAVGDEVEVTAVASSEGGYLDTDRQTTTIVCGANQVLFDIETYGIVLEADPVAVPANGVDLITLTATARMWQDFDITEPTGEPVPLVSINFETNLGQFYGDSVGMTDLAGQTSVYIFSDEPGYATIQAGDIGADVQAEPLVVQFTGLLTLVLDSDPEDWDGSIAQRTEYYCMHLDGWLNGSMFALDHFETRHWHYQVEEEVGAPGDILQMTWTPQGGCADGDPYDYPIMTDVYLHYFYGEDYLHQITVLLSEAHVPLEEVVEVQLTLQDPLQD